MHETVTVGMIVWPLAIMVGIGVVLFGLCWILSIFADAFKH